jgi:hypothetical protein
MKKHLSQTLALIFSFLCVATFSLFSARPAQAATCERVTLTGGQLRPSGSYSSESECLKAINTFGGCKQVGDCTADGYKCILGSGDNLVPGLERCVAPVKVGDSCGSQGQTKCVSFKELICIAGKWANSGNTCTDNTGPLTEATCTASGSTWCASINACQTKETFCPTSCSSDTQCTNGRKCANNICTDLTSSPTDCGKIGNACKTTEYCLNSKCVPDVNHQGGGTTCSCGDGTTQPKGTSTCAQVCTGHEQAGGGGGSCSNGCCTATGTNKVAVHKCSGPLVNGSCSDPNFTTQSGTVCLDGNFCGSMQLDIVDANGNETGTGGVSTNGNSCGETTGPVCLNLSISKSNPKVGDSVTFTCGNVAGATKYEFRVKLPDGTIQALSTTASTTANPKPRTSTALTISSQGAYAAQCRICTGANGSTCQQYESF